MNNANDYAKNPAKRIAWQMPRHPALSDHQHEIIIHEAGGALKRSFQCGNRETA